MGCGRRRRCTRRQPGRSGTSDDVGSCRPGSPGRRPDVNRRLRPGSAATRRTAPRRRARPRGPPRPPPTRRPPERRRSRRPAPPGPGLACGARRDRSRPSSPTTAPVAASPGLVASCWTADRPHTVTSAGAASWPPPAVTRPCQWARLHGPPGPGADRDRAVGQHHVGHAAGHALAGRRGDRRVEAEAQRRLEGAPGQRGRGGHRGLLGRGRGLARGRTATGGERQGEEDRAGGHRGIPSAVFTSSRSPSGGAEPTMMRVVNLLSTRSRQSRLLWTSPWSGAAHSAYLATIAARLAG
jgi:hypothetical protein